MKQGPRGLLAAVAGAVFITVLSARLDFIAGSVPQSPVLTPPLRVFNFLGNGLTLLAILAVLAAAGRLLDRKNLFAAAKEGLIAVVFSGILVQILKAAFARPRVPHAAGYVLHFLENPAFFDFTGKYNSFPSGHTAVSFAAAYALSKKYPTLGVPLYTAALLVAAARVYFGSHFPSDVVAGAFLSVGAAFLLRASGPERREKWIRAGLMLMVVFLSFFKLGGYLLFDVDEAVFSEASREMVETGDYITPTYDYEPRYDKPILIYWFMSSSFRIFGAGEFPARFTSAGFGALLALIVFLFLREKKGLGAAVLATAALSLNLMFFVYSHSAVTDMTLAFFITASLLCFYRALSGGSFLLFWVASALAVLTKGVIGVLFPVAISSIYLVAAGKKRELRALFRPLNILVFLLIALPWFLAEYHVRGREFIDAFIIKHHIKRFTGVISSHSGPFYFYVLILLLGFFPWVAFVPAMLARAWKELRKREGGLYLFSGVWFLFIFLFFSLSRTKLPNYILPTVPALSIMAGLYLSEILEKGTAARASFYLLCAISLVFSTALYILPFSGVRMEIPFTIRFFHTLGGIFLLSAILAAVAPRRTLWATAGLASATAMLLIFLMLHAALPVNSYLQKDLFIYATYAKEKTPGAVLATFELNKPSITFYAARRVERLDRGNIDERLKELKLKKMVVITESKNKAEAEKKTGLHELDSRGEYVLLGSPGLPPLE